MLKTSSTIFVLWSIAVIALVSNPRFLSIPHVPYFFHQSEYYRILAELVSNTLDDIVTLLGGSGFLVNADSSPLHWIQNSMLVGAYGFYKNILDNCHKNRKNIILKYHIKVAEERNKIKLNIMITKHFVVSDKLSTLLTGELSPAAARGRSVRHLEPILINHLVPNVYRFVP